MSNDFNIVWHFPRGSLSKKMSGLELCTFIVHHMPYITPLLADLPVIQRAFQAMFVRLATMAPTVLDEVFDWFTPVLAGTVPPDKGLATDDDRIYLRPPLNVEERAMAEMEAERVKEGIWDTPEARAKHNEHLSSLGCPVIVG